MVFRKHKKGCHIFEVKRLGEHFPPSIPFLWCFLGVNQRKKLKSLKFPSLFGASKRTSSHVEFHILGVMKLKVRFILSRNGCSMVIDIGNWKWHLTNNIGEGEESISSPIRPPLPTGVSVLCDLVSRFPDCWLIYITVLSYEKPILFSWFFFVLIGYHCGKWLIFSSGFARVDHYLTVLPSVIIPKTKIFAPEEWWFGRWKTYFWGKRPIFRCELLVFVGLHPGRLTWNQRITHYRKGTDLPNLHDYVSC